MHTHTHALHLPHIYQNQTQKTTSSTNRHSTLVVALTRWMLKPPLATPASERRLQRNVSSFLHAMMLSSLRASASILSSPWRAAHKLAAVVVPARGYGAAEGSDGERLSTKFRRKDKKKSADEEAEMMGDVESFVE